MAIRTWANLRVEESEQRFKSIIENNPDAVYEMDRNHRFIGANHQCEVLTGYLHAELRNKPCDILVIEEDRPKAIEHMAAAMRGESRTAELTIRHKTGRLVHLHVTNIPIMIDGEVIGIYGIAKDITERKNERDQMAASEQRLRLLSENSLDMIGSMAPDGTVLYVSPACRRIFGYEPDEMIGLKVFDLTTFPEELQEIERWFQEVVLRQDTTSISCRNQRKDGTCVMVETTCKRVLHPETGQVQEIITVSRDISERTRTEEFLRRSEKLSVVGQLAAGVAHEIRNPLTSIRGFVQFMEQGHNLKPDFFQLMLSELDRIELIISEFLVLSKPQALNYHPKDVSVLLHHVTTLLDTQAIMNNVVITTAFDDCLPLVACDENQLKQVFINLLKNAVEAMPDGGVASIELTSEPQHVIVRIIDEGCGIPQAQLAQLGEPFFTTKETGTGLGLMVSQKIIQEHHGELNVQSEEGVGTTITVKLPVADDTLSEIG